MDIVCMPAMVAKSVTHTVLYTIIMMETTNMVGAISGTKGGSNIAGTTLNV